MTVASEVGQRIHTIIAALAQNESDIRVTPQLVVETVRAYWRNSPVGGTTAASARLRCATAVSVYFQHCRPDPTWTLDGTEIRLTEAVADLVWTNTGTGAVMIDEIKSTNPDPDSPGLVDQLERLARSGQDEWGPDFVGVRLVPLGAPARIAVYNVTDGALVKVTGSMGVEPGA